MCPSTKQNECKIHYTKSKTDWTYKQVYQQLAKRWASQTLSVFL